MRNNLYDACEEIDAAMFSGDSFDDPDTIREFQEYLDRWNRKIAEIK